MKNHPGTGRIKKSDVPLRQLVQLLFLAATLAVGIQFYLFSAQAAGGGNISIARPPGVEAFLPLSALIGLKYFLSTGVFSRIHPSSLVLFLTICTTAFFFKRGFCSWICPIGLFSDLLSSLHNRLVKKKFRLPGWLDKAFQGIKYSLAGFFIWAILVRMPGDAAGRFIQSPFNRFADVKMLEFFTRISPSALIAILVLIILSLVLPRFWCRYLCPYGALLGVLGLFSLGKIKRNDAGCTHCRKCEAACPAAIPISRKTGIRSLECSACLRCVDACPQKKALNFSVLTGLSMTPKRLGLALLLLFAAGIIPAKLSGYWQNSIPISDYRMYFSSDQKPEQAMEKIIKNKEMDDNKRQRMKQMIQRMETPHTVPN